MPSFLLGPVKLAEPDDYRCVQSNGVTTTLTDFAPATSGNENSLFFGQVIWNLVNQGSPGEESEGSVKFATASATEIVLRLDGDMRILSPGSDYVQVLVNGGVVFEKLADTTEGQLWYDATIGGATTDPHQTYPWNTEDDLEDGNLVIELTPRPCGNIIEIRGASLATHPTEIEIGIGWIATIVSLV
jgi:hypothetical protein